MTNLSFEVNKHVSDWKERKKKNKYNLEWNHNLYILYKMKKKEIKLIKKQIGSSFQIEKYLHKYLFT